MLCTAIFCLFSITIHDGDTIKAQAPWGMQSFRIWGVAAPELKEEGGIASALHLSDVTRNGPLSCEPRGASFNRFVVVCHTPEGVDVGCEMIRRGAGVEDTRFTRGVYAHCSEN